MILNQKASQIMAPSRSRPMSNENQIANVKMINIGGRPALVSTPYQSANHHGRASIQLALAFAAIYLVWGSTYLAIRYAVETIPPLVAAGLRHSIAGAIMLAWACARGYRPKREHWIAGIIIGAVFFLVGHGTLHWAEQYVGPGLAALLHTARPSAACRGRP